MLEPASANPDTGREDRRQDGAAAAYLACWNAYGEQTRWQLAGDRATIGRSCQADISIPQDPQVSRLHARLERLSGGWTLVDDGLSRNGTVVNGHRLAGRVRLRDRDEIDVGATKLRFCAPGESVEPATLVHEGLSRFTRVSPAQKAVLVALCHSGPDVEVYGTPATNREIAAELHLSVDAVKTHLRLLFRKLGLDDLPQNQKRARLADLAWQNGLSRDRSSDRQGGSHHT